MLIAQKKVQLHLHFKQPARGKYKIAVLLGLLKSNSIPFNEKKNRIEVFY